MASSPTALDPSTLLAPIDQAPLSRFHTRMVVAVGLPWLWAAYGVAVVGFLLASIRATWPLDASLLGLAGSMGLLGMLFGAIFAGGLADRIGRRRTLELATAWVGVFLALSAFAWSFPALLALRLLTGAGLGAILPVASTLASEYSPVAVRGRLLLIISASWGFGGGLAGLVAWLMVPLTGWRGPLLFGGLALLSLPLIRAWVPESIRFLISRGHVAQAEAVARHVRAELGLPASQAAPAQPAADAPRPSEPFSFNQLWCCDYRARTIGLIALWFGLNFIFQGVFIWLPTVLQNEGFPASLANLFTALISLGQIPGAVLAAYFIDSRGRRASMIGFLLVFAACTLIFGFSNRAGLVLLWGILLTVCNGAAWGIGYPYTTELYPTAIRGAATGWATGLGRLGGVVAPYLVGAMIQGGMQRPIIYALLATVPLLSALPVLFLQQEAAGRSLEDVSRP